MVTSRSSSQNAQEGEGVRVGQRMSSFWSRRPTPRQALITLLVTGLAALSLAWLAEGLSTRSLRARLPLEGTGLDEFFLTQLGEDPARVLMTSRRENSTWTRDRGSMAGDAYWIRRYGDPARAGLPERILLTSRSRGAHLFVPLGALDLERALAERADAPPTAPGAEEHPTVRAELAQLYLDRTFAGVYLHLRFPKRPERTEEPGRGEPIDFDLVVVRGNRLRTTDFLLQPDAKLFRSALTAGLQPTGEFRRNANTDDEAVMLLWDEPRTGAEALYLPLSLFDELGLCWGAQLGTIVDDRWRLAELPAFELRPPSAEVRARAAWGGSLHLAARFESADERAALQRALAGFGGS